MQDLAGKICVVTGANTGIGKETARGLASRGATVILACRDAQKGEAARADLAASTGRQDLRVIPLDLADLDSVRAFVATLRAELPRIDVLVNNAGVWTTQRGTTKQGFETTFGVNHLGTFLLTNELLPLLEASPAGRVVTLSSSLHYRGKMQWDDLQSEKRRFSGPTAYNQSKLANVLFTLALARRLAGTKVSAFAVHPGVVATELARSYPKLLVKVFHLFLLSPEQGATCSLHAATAPELEGQTGLYFEKSRPRTPSARARDEEAQERLWRLSEQLVAGAAAAQAA
ncbi:MAG: SDR family oxidoreductase [Myxococcales bacterium]|nr:SDR family oxidoreductase [Myxococcales bacterium]